MNNVANILVDNEKFRSHLLTNIAGIILISSLPIVGLLIFNSHTLGLTIVMFAYTAIVILFSFLIILRKNLPYTVRALAMMLLLFILGIVAYVSYDRMSIGMSFMMTMIVLSLLFYGVSGGIVALTAVITSLSVIAACAISGMFSSTSGWQWINTKLSSWITHGCAVILLSSVFIYATHLLHSRFESFFTNARSQALGLSDINKNHDSEIISTSISKKQFSQYDSELEKVIAERVRSIENLNKALLLKDDIYNRIFESVNEGIVFIDANRKVIYANRQCAAIIGCTQEEVIGRNVSDFLYNDDSAIINVRARDRQMGHSDRYELRVCHAEGHHVWLNISASPLLGMNGKFEMAIVICSDITDRKSAEVKLLESEYKYRMLVEYTDDVLYSIDSSGIILYMSPQIKYYGYDAGEVISRPFTDFIVPEHQETTFDSFRKNMLGRKSIPTQYKMHMKNGDARWVEAVSKTLTDENNNPAQRIGVMRNIHERKIAEEELRLLKESFEMKVVERTMELEEANRDLDREVRERRETERLLRQSELKFRTVADFTYDWEYWIGSDGEYVYISPSVERITGYTTGDFMENPGLMKEIVHPEDKKVVTRHLRRTNSRESAPNDDSMDFRIITKKGETRWMAHYCQDVYDSDGNWLGKRGSNRDITDRKLYETEIHRLNKNIISIHDEETRRLAKELHDGAGQMVTAAKLYLSSYIQDPEKNTQRFNTALHLLETASQEIRDIHSALYPSILTDLGLAAAVRWYITHYIESMGIATVIDININRHYPKEIEVNCYRVIQESCANIIKHSGAAKMELSFQDKRTDLSISIRDNGVGFVYNPPYNGRHGFGLSNMRERIINMNGFIDINSAPGKGTTISILIPLERHHEKDNFIFS